MFKWHLYYRKKVYCPEKSTRSKGNEKYIENIDYWLSQSLFIQLLQLFYTTQEKLGQALVIEWLYVC